MKPGEATREFYRCQGEFRERERIIAVLAEALNDIRPVETHEIGVHSGLSFALELIKGEAE